MAEQVEVDPVRLRAAAGQCDRIRESIRRTLSTLGVVVADGRTPWGDDGFGGKFADGDRGYLAARDNMLAAIEKMADTFGDFAHGQRVAADQLARTEHGNAERFC
ncbi:ESX-1 secretion-associated protein [Nocardia sp. CDC159]|uniref:ESX-1 secretion-associated protein n=1 Tax=Nocardia pulmonis TaxID=2951408 RepID=A0A9X2ED59_9NOCA|nr:MULTISPECIES: ESX-1 secretion-associated protein [Nocardia]MCM6776068.1 ESX-1 secretion-associated protein [Nocardia pulmonis]MCM6788605.1 ESX-1 secretion-associated protein [Nocardia sp. CDC159]